MDLTKSSEAGKRNHVLRMTKAGMPDAAIIAALNVTPGFLSKVRTAEGSVLAKVSELAAQGLSDRVIAKKLGLKYEDSPAIAAAKADVMSKTRTLCKALHKEDATAYVPRFTKQLIDMGVEDSMIYTCFTNDQHDLVAKTLKAFRKAN